MQKLEDFVWKQESFTPETFPLFINNNLQKEAASIYLLEVERQIKYEEEWKILVTKPKGKDLIAV